MATSPRKVLLVVDCSHQTFETVHYVSGVLSPSETEINLLHIISKVPEAFWDMERDPSWQQKVQTVRSWERAQEKKISDCMETLQGIFLNAGFPKSAVHIEVRERKVGVARDIGVESHHGYDAVIVGRRGLSKIPELSLGGVATRVLLKTSDLPVWLIGRTPESGNFIIGIDSSEGSMRAVDHVAKMPLSPAKKILLLHVIRNIPGDNGMSRVPDLEAFQAARNSEAVEKIESSMRSASEKLVQAGISPANIQTKVVTGVASRAGTILDLAKTGGFGTIVVGRRGVSTVQEFDMGRVSNKLVQAAKDRAVWLVG